MALPHFTIPEWIKKDYTEEEKRELMEEEDRKLWENTKFGGMKFTRECEWEDLSECYPFSSPIFVFEDGSRAAWNRYGNIIEIKDDTFTDIYKQS